jgi:hypothetical protein
MKLIFPKWSANTPVEIWLEDVNQDGDYIKKKIFDGKCIYTDKSKQILDAQRQLITLSGKVIIEGDICPYNTFKGYVLINNVKKSVYSLEKPLNPDGSVFSTELNLV